MIEFLRKKLTGVSGARRESNKWLRKHCGNIEGDILSIGSGDDSDNQGDFYKNYFYKASSYTNSEVSEDFNSNLTVDVRSMPEIKDESFDCVFCSGVLEHVDNYKTEFYEITRIFKNEGILLLGLPFRQALHMAPHDFWRFTEYGIRHMPRESYEIHDLVSIDKRPVDFPAAYWVKAKKVTRL